MSKPKNIAIFLDGTWNDVEDCTNVYNLYQLSLGVEIDIEGNDVSKSTNALNGFNTQNQPMANRDKDSDGYQIRYYDSGVGTASLYSPPLLGGIIGHGLKMNVAQAYLMLSRQYQEHDNIYVFGYSRGAYTARSLIGLINNLGLLKPRFTASRRKPPPVLLKPVRKLLDFLAHRKELKYALKAVDAYREATFMNDTRKKRHFKKFSWRYCQRLTINTESDLNPYRVPVKFAGMWDTVGAMGIPSLLDPLGKKVKKGDQRRKRRSFIQRNFMPNKVFPQNVAKACHALAIDEHRNHFCPTLWEKPKRWVRDDWARRCEQRWFVGAHGNVGGGNPDNMLSNKPLNWIYENAKESGLHIGHFNMQHDDVHTCEPITDTYSGYALAYKMMGLGRNFRPIRLCEEEGTNFKKGGEHLDDPSQTLDVSVVQRLNFDPQYRTLNLMRLSQDEVEGMKKIGAV